MTRSYRLVLLFFSLILLIVIGRLLTGSFSFMINDYWFISGILLVILLSLIDQPFFSTEANIFVNSVTAWMSLILLPQNERTITWKLLFALTLYLLISSYIMMWSR